MSKSFFIGSLFLGFTICLFSQTNGTLNISQPVNGNRVPQIGNTISFTSKNNVPPNMIPVVFIQDPTGQWWPHINSVKSQDNNFWTLNNVQYGAPDDHKQTFNIQVLVINRNLVNNGFTFSGQTLFVVNNSALSLPAFVHLRQSSNAFSPVISVIRQ